MSTDVFLTDRAGAFTTKLKTIGDVSYERRLGGDGGIALTASSDHPSISGPNRPLLEEWAAEVAVLRDGVPVANGPVLAIPTADPLAGTVQVTAGTPFAWLKERQIRSTLTYTNVDQATILAALVAYAQNTTLKGPYAGFRLTTSTPATGVLRTRTYDGVQRKNVAEAVAELSTVLGGMDLDITLAISGGVVTRTLTSTYPMQGSLVPQPLRLGQGGLTSLTVQRPGGIVTRVDALGNGEGSTQKIGSAAATSTVEARYGVHETSISYTDVSVLATLNDQAAEYLRLRQPPLQIISASYVACPATPYRFVNLGDTVHVIADRGWIHVDTILRVVAEKVTVTPGGIERIDLTFNDPLAA